MPNAPPPPLPLTARQPQPRQHRHQVGGIYGFDQVGGEVRRTFSIVCGVGIRAEHPQHDGQGVSAVAVVVDHEIAQLAR